MKIRFNKNTTELTLGVFGSLLFTTLMIASLSYGGNYLYLLIPSCLFLAISIRYTIEINKKQENE